MPLYRVIPVMRTPHGVEGFDYRSESTFEPGDAVWIPFRRGKILGIVESIIPSSPYKEIKEITGRYAEIKFGETSIELSKWLAKQTFTSLPSLWKSWLRDYPKRPRSQSIASFKKKQKPDISAHWKCSSRFELISEAMKALQSGERILIISPLKHRALSIASELDILCYTSDLNAGDAFSTWGDFASGSIQGLVTTRVGAWLSLYAQRIFIDTPEHDEHKQDEVSPRFDARKIALKTAELIGIPVSAFGLNPPLHSDDMAPSIDASTECITRLRAGYSRIPMIQEQCYQALLESEQPIVVIHPIKFELAKLTCRDCGWHPICTNCGFTLSQQDSRTICRRCSTKSYVPDACEHCSGTDLGKSLPGIEKLKRTWQSIHPELNIEWRGVTAEELDTPLPKRALVLVTDADLLAAGEDIRKHERLCHTVRRLADEVRMTEGNLLLQTSEQTAHLWLPWLTADGYAAWRKQERHTRELFGYPPSQRVIKVLFDGNEEQAHKWMKLAEHTLETIQTRGPFEVPFRAKTRKQRHVIHLLPKENRITDALLTQLSTIQKPNLYIDLDPIAFFR